MRRTGQSSILHYKPDELHFDDWVETDIYQIYQLQRFSFSTATVFIMHVVRCRLYDGLEAAVLSRTLNSQSGPEVPITNTEPSNSMWRRGHMLLMALYIYKRSIRDIHKHVCIDHCVCVLKEYICSSHPKLWWSLWKPLKLNEYQNVKYCINNNVGYLLILPHYTKYLVILKTGV